MKSSNDPFFAFSHERLAEWSHGTWHGIPQSPITGFSLDSRTLEAGQLFIAVKTPHNDGHSFLMDALAKGSPAALVEKFSPEVPIPQLLVSDSLEAFRKIACAYRLSHQCPVVGVTGSVGKTSTKELLRCLLGQDQTHATKVNLNNTIGVPLTLMALRPHHAYAVIEAGINLIGEMDLLTDTLRPDHVLFTGIHPVHLEGLGESLESIAHEKAKLARHAHSIVLPIECLQFEAFRALSQPITALFTHATAPTTRYPNNVRLYSYTFEENSNSLSILSTDGPPQTFQLPHWNHGMVQNAVLALTLASQLGVPTTALQERIWTWVPPPLRGQMQEKAGKTYFIDCYNSNPTALLDRMQAFEKDSDPTLPRYYVLGGMGELGKQSDYYHHSVGTHIRLREQDKLVCIGDWARPMRDGALQAGNSPEQVSWVATVPEVSPLLEAFRGSVLLKASKSFALWKVLDF